MHRSWFKITSACIVFWFIPFAGYSAQVNDAFTISLKDSSLYHLIAVQTGQAGGDIPVSGSSEFLLSNADCTVILSMTARNELYQNQADFTVTASSGQLSIAYNILRITATLNYHISGSGSGCPSPREVTSSVGYSFNNLTPSGSPLAYTLSVVNGSVDAVPVGSPDMGLEGGSFTSTPDLGSYAPWRSEIEAHMKSLASQLLSIYIRDVMEKYIENAFNKDLLDLSQTFSSAGLLIGYKLSSADVLSGFVTFGYSASLSSAVPQNKSCSYEPVVADTVVLPLPSNFTTNTAFGVDGHFVSTLVSMQAKTGELCSPMQTFAKEFLGLFPELIGTLANTDAESDLIVIYVSPPRLVYFETGQIGEDTPGFINVLSMPVTLVYSAYSGGGTFFKGEVTATVPVYFERASSNRVAVRLDLYNASVVDVGIREDPLNLTSPALKTFFSRYVLPLAFKNFARIDVGMDIFNPSTEIKMLNPYGMKALQSGLLLTVNVIKSPSTSDNQPPVVQIPSPPSENNVNAFAITLNLSDNLTPVSQVRYTYRIIDAYGNVFPYAPERWSERFGGSALTINLPYVPDGPLTLEVVAFDNVDISSSDSVSFMVDTVPPFTFLTSVPDGFFQPLTFHFEYTGDDYFRYPYDLSFSWKVDSGTWSPFSPTPYADVWVGDSGRHVFYVRAQDPAGNIGDPVTWVFAVDTTPPDTEITEGPARYTKGVRECIKYTATDDLQSGNFDYYYSLDKSAYSGPTRETTKCYNWLSEGSHIFEVYAVDGAGNRDPEPDSIAFTVDRTPPVIEPLSVPEEEIIDQRYVEFHFRVTDSVNSSSEIKRLFLIDGGSPMSVTDYIRLDLVTMGFFTPKVYVFTFKAIDSAGNQSSWTGTSYVSILGIITRGRGGCGVVPYAGANESALSWFTLLCITLLSLWALKRRNQL